MAMVPFGERKATFRLQCTAEVPLVDGGGVERPQYVFEGALDEVAACNRALSQVEVKEVMEGIGQILAAVAIEDKLSITWGKIKDFKR
mgnify:CR=1 FL=1